MLNETVLKFKIHTNAAPPFSVTSKNNSSVPTWELLKCKTSSQLFQTLIMIKQHLQIQTPFQVVKQGQA